MPAPNAPSAHVAPRRSLRTIGLGLSTRLWSAASSKPARVFYTNGGVGDELMLTAIAAAARRAGRPISIVATYPALWRNNSDPASLHRSIDRWHYARRRRWISTEIIHLSYDNHAPRHLARQMADRVGVELPADWTPVLRYPRRERAPRRIVFQLSCRGARFSADTKEWAHDRWLALLERLRPDFELVQLGTGRDPSVPGVIDLRGRTDLIEAASLIGSAGLFLGLESGLAHVAAATRVPAVIIQGGRTAPSLTGYSWHRHLVRTPPCAHCALNTGCPHRHMCLDIPVDEVEAAVRETIAAP